jgi:general secretion pathway protein A
VYKKFFGLADNPFNIVPDPRYLFDTPETDKAFANLMFGVRAHRGIILLTGEVGTGKTLLLKKLMNGLRDESAATAFVFNPQLNPTEFLDFVLSDFGIPHDNREKLRMVNAFYRWLLSRQRTRQTSVLIVDEAHDLTPDVLEEIRLFSNLETPSDKLLQIVLSGQPEIEKKLALPEMQLFRQRIAMRRQTAPLSREETSRYIAHRIHVAGGEPSRVFSPEAMACAFDFSQGIPRVINLICEQALISAYADEEKPVGASKVKEAAQQFRLESSASPMSRLPAETVETVRPAHSAPPPSDTSKPDGPPDNGEERPLAPQPARNAGPAGGAELVAPTAQPPPAAKSSESKVKDVSSETSHEAPAAPLPPTTPGKPAGKPSAVEVGPSRETTPAPMEHPVRLADEVLGASQLFAQPSVEFAKVDESRAPAGPPDVSVHAAKPQIPVREKASDASPEEEVALRNPPATTRAAKESNVSSRAARQNLRANRRPGAARRLRPSTAPPLRLGQPPIGSEGRPKSLVWTAIVIVAAGMALSGYYAGKNPFVLKKLRQAFHLRSQPVKVATPPASAPAPGKIPQKPATKNAALPPAAVQPAKVAPKEVAVKEKPPSVQIPRTPPQTQPASPPLEIAHRQAQRPQEHEAAQAAPKVELPPVAEPAVGRLLVTSNVSGATVTLDGRSDPNWLTPHTFTNLRPGSYEVAIFRQGYLEARQNVNVESGELMIMSATLVTPSGELVVTTDPPDAEVFIDGKAYGRSPVRASVEAGRHAYSARMEGHETVRGDATIQDQAVVTRNLYLPPVVAPPTANVQVTTNPPQAAVYADGTPMGTTPVAFHLIPGTHTIIISASGYRPIRREVEVPKTGIATVVEVLSAE